MISTKGRYALRVMIDLAVYSNDKYISLKEIAEREEISLKYLEQVVSLLYKAGYVLSLRGNNGGYRLSKPANKITAGDVLRAAEGTLANVQCLITNDPTSCPHYAKCSTIEFWKGFDDVVNNYVDNYTIADLAENYKNKLEYEYFI